MYSHIYTDVHMYRHVSLGKTLGYVEEADGLS